MSSGTLKRSPSIPTSTKPLNGKAVTPKYTSAQIISSKLSRYRLFRDWNVLIDPKQTNWFGANKRTDGRGAIAGIGVNIPFLVYQICPPNPSKSAITPTRRPCLYVKQHVPALLPVFLSRPADAAPSAKERSQTTRKWIKFINNGPIEWETL